MEDSISENVSKSDARSDQNLSSHLLNNKGNGLKYLDDSSRGGLSGGRSGSDAAVSDRDLRKNGRLTIQA